MPTPPDITITVTPPNPVANPFEEQKKMLIAKAQNIITEFPTFKNELNLPIMNLKWSNADNIQERIGMLSAAIEKVKQKIPSTEEAQIRIDTLNALSIELHEQKKQAELQKLKTTARELVTKAKELRDFNILTNESQAALLNHRMSLNLALLTNNPDNIKAQIQALSDFVNGFSRPLSNSEDSPELGRRNLTKPT